MQKFIVPQFIDIENKILGPITVRQFVTIAVAGVFLFAAYKLATFKVFLGLGSIIVIVAMLFGFVKFNGLAFHLFLLNMLSTLKKPTLRIWMKEEPTISHGTTKKKKGAKEEPTFVPKRVVSSEKLSEHALIIDTGGIYKGEEEANRINKALYAK